MDRPKIEATAQVWKEDGENTRVIAEPEIKMEADTSALFIEGLGACEDEYVAIPLKAIFTALAEGAGT